MKIHSIKFLAAVLFSAIFFFACNTDSGTNDIAEKSYESFKKKISDKELDAGIFFDAEVVARSHPDEIKKKEAEDWLKKYKAEIEAMRSSDKNKIEDRRAAIDSMGGVTVLEQTFGKEKCNLQSGSYVSNKILDSAGYAKLAKLLVDDLWEKGERKKGCDYNYMCQAFIFKTKKRYQEYSGNSVAGAFLSSDRSDVWVNAVELGTLNLDKLK